MGSLPVVLLLCSFHGTAAKQNTQIILFNYGWVPACLFLCCETLPSCGFCSTALTAVAQEPQPGEPPHRVTLKAGARYGAWLPLLLSLVSRVPTLIVSFPFQRAPWHLQPPYLRVSHRSPKIVSALSGLTDWPSSSPVSADCREEMYPCTRMYSVHRPIKQCVGAMCFYRWCRTPTRTPAL